MDCAGARERLHDLNRGRLTDGSAEAVRDHVATCAACAAALQVDAELRHLVRAKAPYHAAPPALRARIQSLLEPQFTPRRRAARLATRRPWLFGRRWALGGLAGALAAILVVWAGSFWVTRDPFAALADGAVAEHKEYVEQTMALPIADPQAIIRQVQREVQYAFGPIFPGDSQDYLVAGTVSDLAGTRTAAFTYRDSAGKYTTLFLVPEAAIHLPRDGRMRIDTITPYHRVVAGRQVYLWFEGKLLYVLVSDRDQGGSASMFLKIRTMR